MDYEASITTYSDNTLLFNETTLCHIEDGTLSYSNETDEIRINLNKFRFVKENNESILSLTSDYCALKLKELNKSVDIPIIYINYTIQDNKRFILEYKLLSQEETLKIVIETDAIKNEL